ncbi:MAG: sugar phosphate isomerase/epimerase family protein [Rhodothermales bacterium]|nr:sugar phosphate isomerase/epimerase family protein [Rhodothermales bacterium]
MHPVSRRHFLKTTGRTLSLAAFAGLSVQCGGQAGTEQAAGGRVWTGFKYAMCNECMQELPWSEQCRIMSDAGYTGVEIAPFTLVRESVNELGPAQRQELVRVMGDYGLECVGLHWLLAPPPQGLHFTTPDPVVRAATVQYLADLVDFCADLGGRVLIFGSPNQRNTQGISVAEAKQHFIEGLTRVADHAGAREVKILVETLDSSQTDVVNTMAESVEIVRAVDKPAVGTMFDYHNTLDETETLESLIRTHFDRIEHVQIQEMDGRHLGTGTARDAYVDSFRALRQLGYDKWISLEIFDFTPGGVVIAQESMEVLRALEAASA